MSLSLTHTIWLLTWKWTALTIEWLGVIRTLISFHGFWILVPVTKGIEGTDDLFQDTIGYICVIAVGAPRVDCALFGFVTFPVPMEPNMTIKQQTLK